MGVVRQKWNDKAFERQVLNPKIVRFLNWIGAKGEAITKRLTADAGPLHAVDTGRLLNSWTFEVDERRLIVRIGSNLLYAIFVLMGTFKMKARPILRTMLAMLKVELR